MIFIKIPDSEVNQVDKKTVGLEFLRNVRKDLKNKNNVNILVVGREGSGKSWLSLRLASAFDPKFTMDRVKFELATFYRMLKSVNKDMPFIMEEMGVQADNRNWYSQGNKGLTHIMQTYRNKRLIGIFNLPDVEDTDKKIRKRFHIMLNVLGKDLKRGVTRAVPYRIYKNQIEGITYPVGLTIKIGRYPYKISYLEFYAPPKNLTDEYETQIEQFKNDVIDKEEKLASLQARTSIIWGYDEIVSDMLKNPDNGLRKYMKAKKVWKLNERAIGQRYRMSYKRAKALASRLYSEDTLKPLFTEPPKEPDKELRYT